MRGALANSSNTKTKVFELNLSLGAIISGNYFTDESLDILLEGKSLQAWRAYFLNITPSPQRRIEYQSYFVKDVEDANNNQESLIEATVQDERKLLNLIQKLH